jgi:glutamate 5-kinase
MSPSTELPEDRLAVARSRVSAARRVVVKVGTNVVMADDGALALGRLYGLIEAVAGERRRGREMVVVSSGAVGLGAQRLGLAGKPKTLALKQAARRSGRDGSCRLVEAFEKVGVTAAQVLLTEDDFSSRAGTALGRRSRSSRARAGPERERHRGNGRARGAGRPGLR